MILLSKIKYFLDRLTSPVSKNEDRARSEFILNVLLIACIALSCIAFIMNLVKGLMGIDIAVSAIVIFIPLSFFVFLYFLSRKGYARLSSFILLTIFCSLVSYMQYKWGVDLPMEILSQVLVIVMAGILIGTKAAFIATFVVSLIIATIAYLQKTN